MDSQPVRIRVSIFGHIPTLIMRALLTSLVGLKERFKWTSLSDEGQMSRDISSFLRLGNEASPNSTN